MSSHDFEFETPEPEKLPVDGREGAETETETKIDDGMPTYSDEELEAVFDSILFEGSYSEEISVGGKVKALIRTRTGEDARAIMMTLDASRVSMGLTMESLRSLYNLGYSLMSFNGQDLSGMKIEDRIKRIEKLPSAVLGALIRKLVMFDLKVEAAVSHGEANF